MVPALEVQKRPAWHSMSAGELRAELAARGKCSAMVKVTGAPARRRVSWRYQTARDQVVTCAIIKLYPTRNQ